MPELMQSMWLWNYLSTTLPKKRRNAEMTFLEDKHYKSQVKEGKEHDR